MIITIKGILSNYDNQVRKLSYRLKLTVHIYKIGLFLKAFKPWQNFCSN